jgi:hypothetical protein
MNENHTELFGDSVERSFFLIICALPKPTVCHVPVAQMSVIEYRAIPPIP